MMFTCTDVSAHRKWDCMHATLREALHHASANLAQGEVGAVVCKQLQTTALEEAVRIIERAKAA
jgi:hypothetical protein